MSEKEKDKPGVEAWLDGKYKWPPEPGAWTQWFGEKHWAFVTTDGRQFDLYYSFEHDLWFCSEMVNEVQNAQRLSVSSLDKALTTRTAWKAFQPECPRDAWLSVPEWKEWW